MDSLMTEMERIFEETLTKNQLNDMLTKKIRPVHWTDGNVSYFRIQKIIDVLQEEKKPLDPNLDVAINVLSDGKAKIRNQSHKDFCRDIKAKMDDVEGQTDEDLQQPVECLVPGCFPIGPECESLGISGDILFSSEKSFPEAIDPASITNRVMFELGEYVPRLKESYESLAGWIKKIMGWGDEFDLPPKMVEEWRTTLMRETRKKKKSSLSLAQKYLLEKFAFPGLVVPAPSSNQSDTSNMKAKLDNEGTGILDVEFSGDEKGDNRQQDMDKASFLDDQADSSSKKISLLTTSPPDEEAKDGENDAKDSGDTMDGGGDEIDEKEATKASTSHSSRKTSSRNAAKAAIGKIITSEPKKQSPHSKDAANRVKGAKDNTGRMSGESNKKAANAPKSLSSRQTSSRGAARAALGKMSTLHPQERRTAVTSVGKKETRASTSLTNAAKRTPAKKITRSKQQRPAQSTRRKRKLESSDEDDDDDDEDEDEDDNDADEDDEDEDEDEDEDDDEEEDEEDESSAEEGELKTPRKGISVNTYRSKIMKDITEASKLFTSLSKVANNLKKEMRIAMEYLDNESSKICKNLVKAEKKLEGVLKMMKLEQAKSDREDEEDESSKEEESEEETPVKRTRGSQQTKKITVQVEAGVKAKLKKPLVKVARITRTKGQPKTSTQNLSRANKTPSKSMKTPIRVSRQNAQSGTSPRSSRSTTSVDTLKQGTEEISNFDKEKLFSSRVSVSLMKIDSDIVLQALEKNDNLTEDEVMEQENSSSDELAKKNPAKRAKRKIDSDSNDEEDMVEDDETKNIEKKNLPRRGEESKTISGEKKKMTKVDNAKTRGGRNQPRRGQEHNSDSDGDEDPALGKSNKSDEDDQESKEEENGSSKRRARSGRFRSQKTVPRKSADLHNAEKTSKSDSSECEQRDSEEEEDSASRRPIQNKSRKSRNDTLEDKDVEVISSDEEDRQSTRSSRSSQRIKHCPEEAKSDSAERSSRRSWREKDKSPTDDIAKVAKSSEIDSPYSGSEDDDVPRRSEPSAFAALAAGMSSFGDWRGASPKEKVKKRSLNDFVKQLNNPKKRKTDSGKKTLPRKTNVEHKPDDKSSEEDGTGSLEKEYNDDDFLEYQNSNGSLELSAAAEDNDKVAETNGEERADEIEKKFEMEGQGENGPPNGDGEQNHSISINMDKDIPAAKQEFQKESEIDDEFPGDAIVGKRVRHRCSMGMHNLYKWYEGTVVHKSTASELLKLDEEQFGHLNNLYTFYSVKYDDQEEVQAKALEYDWDRENLKLCQ